MSDLHDLRVERERDELRGRVARLESDLESANFSVKVAREEADGLREIVDNWSARAKRAEASSRDHWWKFQCAHEESVELRAERDRLQHERDALADLHQEAKAEIVRLRGIIETQAVEFAAGEAPRARVSLAEWAARQEADEAEADEIEAGIADGSIRVIDLEASADRLAERMARHGWEPLGGGDLKQAVRGLVAGMDAASFRPHPAAPESNLTPPPAAHAATDEPMRIDDADLDIDHPHPRAKPNCKACGGYGWIEVPGSGPDEYGHEEPDIDACGCTDNRLDYPTSTGGVPAWMAGDRTGGESRRVAALGPLRPSPIGGCSDPDCDCHR